MKSIPATMYEKSETTEWRINFLSGVWILKWNEEADFENPRLTVANEEGGVVGGVRLNVGGHVRPNLAV
jgi:hypothetical protein